MRRNVVAAVLSVAVLFIYGCNIVPKAVQYQREEEKTIGSTDIANPIVEEIQVVLNSLGYETGNAEGRMGQKTREAIKEFQESIGLKNTGYVDKNTLEQIEEIRRSSAERQLRESYRVDVRSPYSENKISGSAFTPAIKDIQTALKKSGFDPGAVDGKMGPRTRQAIKEFQRTKGLVPDGKVGPKTWAELGKYLKQ